MSNIIRLVKRYNGKTEIVTNNLGKIIFITFNSNEDKEDFKEDFRRFFGWWIYTVDDINSVKMSISLPYIKGQTITVLELFDDVAEFIKDYVLDIQFDYYDMCIYAFYPSATYKKFLTDWENSKYCKFFNFHYGDKFRWENVHHAFFNLEYKGG